MGETVDLGRQHGPCQGVSSSGPSDPTPCLDDQGAGGAHIAAAMLVNACLERIVAHVTGLDDGADFSAARGVFEQRTGPFADGDRWYEERIRLFLDWYVCEWRAEDGRSPVERFLAGARDVGEIDRAVAVGLARSARSLYQALDVPGLDLIVADRLGGGRFRVRREAGSAAERIRMGDQFDGRLLSVGDAIHVAPGPLFHPRIAHEAIERLLLEAANRGVGGTDLLDGLLRMRMRLDRFASIRAQHIYRFDALLEEDVRSAPWAR